jgi:hypothetical protein
VAGPYNSSLTRVQPFFEQLVERDPTGETWLPRLLAIAPRAHEVLGDAVDQPGRLLTPLLGHQRRARLDDEPPGREEAEAQARQLVEENDPSVRGWWRFEGVSSTDCLIATERLIITVEGKRTEPLSPSTTGIRSGRSSCATSRRQQLAWRRRWGTLRLGAGARRRRSAARLAEQRQEAVRVGACARVGGGLRHLRHGDHGAEAAGGGAHRRACGSV